MLRGGRWCGRSGGYGNVERYQRLKNPLDLTPPRSPPSLAYTLAITPLRQITGWAWLTSYRRMLGLFVFFYATVHMAIYFGLDLELQFAEIWTSIVKRPYITIGMLSWLMLVPLAITSPHAIARRLGGLRWKRLHRLTYVVAVTATTHYLWAVKKDTFWPLVYFVLFAALLTVRVVRWRRERSRT